MCFNFICIDLLNSIMVHLVLNPILFLKLFEVILHFLIFLFIINIMLIQQNLFISSNIKYYFIHFINYSRNCYDIIIITK
jgi:hypothetical protein